MIYLTFRDTFNQFLKTNALYIALVVVGIILVTLLVLLLKIKKK